MERLFNYGFMGQIAEFVPKEVKSVSKSLEILQLRNMLLSLEKLRNENSDLFPYLKNLTIDHVDKQDNLIEISKSVNSLFKMVVFDIEKLVPREDIEPFSINYIHHLMAQPDLKERLIKYRQILQNRSLEIFGNVLREKLHLRSIPIGSCEEIRRWFTTEHNQTQIRAITRLDLSEMNLLCIPDEMRFFTGLRTLLLQKNSIMEIPSFFGELINLRDLSLSYNRIKYLPTEIGGLIHLNYLLLEGNKIGLLPEQIGELIGLITLNLNNNEIRRLPDTICDIKQLRTLKLEDNNLTGLPADFYRLFNLRELEVAKNLISRIPAYLQRFFEDRWFALGQQRAVISHE